MTTIKLFNFNFYIFILLFYITPGATVGSVAKLSRFVEPSVGRTLAFELSIGEAT